MTNNLIIIQSMASDLKRISQSLHRGSTQSAKKFSEEILRRRLELNQNDLPEYLRRIIGQLESKLDNAEDTLMYSTLLQNFSLRHYSSASS